MTLCVFSRNVAVNLPFSTGFIADWEIKCPRTLVLVRETIQRFECKALVHRLLSEPAPPFFPRPQRAALRLRLSPPCRLPQEAAAAAGGFGTGNGTLFESTSTSMVLLMDAVTVTGNRALGGNGGGIFVDPHSAGPGNTNITLVYVDSEVSGNLASGGGGGISANEGVSVVLRGLLVADNVAAKGSVRKLLEMPQLSQPPPPPRHPPLLCDGLSRPAPPPQGGGALLARTHSVSLDAVTFRGNSAGDSGGAAFVSAAPVLPISAQLASVLALSNTAGVAGGGFAFSGPLRADLSAAIIALSSAGLAGGGVWVANGSTVRCVSCNVSANAVVSLGAGDDADDITTGGGAVSVGPRAEASFIGSDLVGNSVTLSGGAVNVVGPSAVVMLTGGSVSGNMARFGGAVALAGAARLAISSAAVANNSCVSLSPAVMMHCSLLQPVLHPCIQFHCFGICSSLICFRLLRLHRATLGGVFAFSKGAAVASTVALSALSGGDNDADAGAWAGSADGTAPFSAPACDGCAAMLAPTRLGSYGTPAGLATGPARLEVEAAPSTGTGRLLVITLRLHDGFGSLIRDLPTAVARVDCISTVRPAPAGGVGNSPAGRVVPEKCDATATLRGEVSGIYRNSAAVLDVVIFGEPRAVYVLEASLYLGGTGGGAAAAAAAAGSSLLKASQFNVTMEPCRALERYAGDSRLCQCVENAEYQTRLLACQCGARFQPTSSGAACEPAEGTVFTGGTLRPWVVPVAVAVPVSAFAAAALLWVHIVRSRLYSRISLQKCLLPPRDLFVVRPAHFKNASADRDRDGSAGESMAALEGTGEGGAGRDGALAGAHGSAALDERGIVVDYRGSRVLALAVLPAGTPSGAGGGGSGLWPDRAPDGALARVAEGGEDSFESGLVHAMPLRPQQIGRLSVGVEVSDTGSENVSSIASAGPGWQLPVTQQRSRAATIDCATPLCHRPSASRSIAVSSAPLGHRRASPCLTHPHFLPTHAYRGSL